MRWRDRCRPHFEFIESPFAFFLAVFGSSTERCFPSRSWSGALANEAGVTRVHCHLLRHTFATNYLVREVGDPLRSAADTRSHFAWRW